MNNENPELRPCNRPECDNTMWARQKNRLWCSDRCRYLVWLSKQPGGKRPRLSKRRPG